MSSVKTNETNKIDEIKTYFKGVKSEWGKITWPQKQQVWVETLVVLFVVTFLTLMVYVIDISFKWLFQFLK